MDFHLTFILNLGFGLLFGQILWWLFRHICQSIRAAFPTPTGQHYKTKQGKDTVASWTVTFHGPYDGPGKIRRLLKELFRVKG